jgi:5-methylcytosine-specific restriction endonuclease McrA
MARRNLGTSKAWECLKAKLESQNFRCAYSGIPLTLGINASVDHIYPVTLYPHLKNDPENVQWVEWRVNQIKSNFPPDVFLALVESIALHRINGISQTEHKSNALATTIAALNNCQDTRPRKMKAVS